MKLRFLLVLGMVMVSSFAFSQIDYASDAFANYGATPEQREENHKIYSYFNNEYAGKNFPVASIHLKHLLEEAPKIHQNLYIKGGMIYKNLAAKAKTLDERSLYVDSLMIIYDLRIENFGDDEDRGSGYILGEKLKDNLKYAPARTDEIMEIVDIATSTASEGVDVSIYPIYFKYISDKYANDEIETTVLLGEYEQLIAAIEESTKSDDEAKKSASASIESVLMSSGAASCENLEIIFKAQFEASPEDKDVLEKIVTTLARSKCTSDFQLTVSEKLYSIEPTGTAAAGIATAYAQKEDYETALKYYEEAVEKETDNTKKSAYALGASGVSLSAKKISDAIKFAKIAININSEDGFAYYLLAQAQAQTKGNCTAFQQKAVYWIVVDNLYKAKATIDENYLDAVNKAIATYSQYFPSSEDIFFDESGAKVGGSYTVNCGAVSGTTTVRSNGK